jgi:RNA polymerase sigma-70 factor (ECF subfamily)
MAQSAEPSLEAAVNGDREALSTLLRRHGPDVRRRLKIGTVWRAALDPADVMQVTYLEAFLRIDQLRARTEEAFVAWLTRLAQNNVRDGIRALERQKRPAPRRQVRRRGPADSSSTLLRNLNDPAIKTPSRDAAGRESQQVLTAALAQLPPLYAQVVRLHDLEGQPVAEVAATLARSPGAVCMLRARALDRLRELLGSQSQFFSDGA